MIIQDHIDVIVAAQQFVERNKADSKQVGIYKRTSLKEEIT